MCATPTIALHEQADVGRDLAALSTDDESAAAQSADSLQYLPHRSGGCSDRVAKAIVTSSACGGARVVVVAKALQDLRAATRQAERPTVDSALPGTLKGCYYSRQCGEAAMRMKFIGYAGDFTSSARGERADNGADGRGSMRPIFGHAAGAAREVFRMDERLVQLPDQDAMDRLHPVPAKHRERESLVRTIPQ